jgi:1,4-alpha-glucan branching enzyme
MINLAEVGAHVSRGADQSWHVRFGIYLPGITYDKGYAVKVRVIHERDQLVRGIEPRDFDLFWHNGSEFDLWDATVQLDQAPGSHFGQTGTYLYRYQLLRGGRVVALWFTDPFARKTGVGTLSAFTVDPNEAGFPWTDGGFQPPEVDDMVVYELHVGEFNTNFDGLIAQLDYLRDLGVNTLELMPVTNVKEEIEWGYTPLGFFAADERFGGGTGMKRLVDACHAKGIAVIVDAVYAHAHPHYPYNLVYNATGEPNPMMGWFEEQFFDQPGMDYRKAFTRDYFLTVNRYWLEEFHVDGFRYDYIPGIYDGPAGQGYARLVFETYRLSQTMPRFQTPEGRSRIIQCAEHLPDPRGIISQTYSNTCWQNGLLDRAIDVAWGGSLSALAHQLDPELIGYPREYRNPDAGDVFPVAPFQYFESHDHSRFISRIAPGPIRDLLGETLGDRSQFYRLQPYVIALYTAKGIPMLWHGQEFGENWSVPHWGIGRVLYSRPLHWEYFYDSWGRALIRLYRIMGGLRRTLRCLNSRGGFFYFNEESHRRQGVIAFRRHTDAANDASAQDALVFLNFSGQDAEVWVPFPRPGQWQEQIDKDDNPRPPVAITDEGQWHPVAVPSNYGCLYLLNSG